MTAKSNIMADTESDKSDNLLIKKEWGDPARKFIEALQLDTVAGIYSLAAQVAGVNRQYMYVLMEKFPEFEIVCKGLREAAKRYKGDIAEAELMKLVRESNVTAVIFGLKKYNPKEFGDKGQDDGAGAIPVTHTLSPELMKIVKKLTKNDK